MLQTLNPARGAFPGGSMANMGRFTVHHLTFHVFKCTILLVYNKIIRIPGLSYKKHQTSVNHHFKPFDDAGTFNPIEDETIRTALLRTDSPVYTIEARHQYHASKTQIL